MGAPNRINVIDVRVTPSTTEQQNQGAYRQIGQQASGVRAVTVSEHLSHNEDFGWLRP